MPEERNDARQLSPVLENYLEIIFHQEIRKARPAPVPSRRRRACPAPPSPAR